VPLVTRCIQLATPFLTPLFALSRTLPDWTTNGEICVFYIIVACFFLSLSFLMLLSKRITIFITINFSQLRRSRRSANRHAIGRRETLSPAAVAHDDADNARRECRAARRARLYRCCALWCVPVLMFFFFFRKKNQRALQLIFSLFF
jgi:hypothetical protein